MTPNVLKCISVVCFILCAGCLFVAYERYRENAASVNAIKEFAGSTPLGDVFGLRRLKPSIPAATKYALVSALLSGAGGVASLLVARSKRDGAAARAREPDGCPSPPFRR
jgi:hypothetical protein